MEKERSSKIIAIVALIVGIVGLTVGFAAFTRDLNITFSESNVKVSGDLDVKILASNTTTDTTKTVVGELDGATSALDATISDDGLTISGLGATFDGKGQSVEYDFYIYNNSEYDAYLKKVEFLNYTGEQKNKVCTAVNGTTQTLVDASCNDISLTIEVGGEEVINTQDSNFSSPGITKGTTVAAKIIITYNDGTGTAKLPDGDFKINFGGIRLSYSSLT